MTSPIGSSNSGEITFQEFSDDPDNPVNRERAVSAGVDLNVWIEGAAATAQGGMDKYAITRSTELAADQIRKAFLAVINDDIKIGYMVQAFFGNPRLYIDFISGELIEDIIQFAFGDKDAFNYVSDDTIKAGKKYARNFNSAFGGLIKNIRTVIKNGGYNTIQGSLAIARNKFARKLQNTSIAAMRKGMISGGNALLDMMNAEYNARGCKSVAVAGAGIGAGAGAAGAAIYQESEDIEEDKESQIAGWAAGGAAAGGAVGYLSCNALKSGILQQRLGRVASNLSLSASRLANGIGDFIFEPPSKYKKITQAGKKALSKGGAGVVKYSDDASRVLTRSQKSLVSLYKRGFKAGSSAAYSAAQRMASTASRQASLKAGRLFTMSPGAAWQGLKAGASSVTTSASFGASAASKALGGPVGIVMMVAMILDTVFDFIGACVMNEPMNAKTMRAFTASFNQVWKANALSAYTISYDSSGNQVVNPMFPVEVSAEDYCFAQTPLDTYYDKYKIVLQAWYLENLNFNSYGQMICKGIDFYDDDDLESYEQKPLTQYQNLMTTLGNKNTLVANFLAKNLVIIIILIVIAIIVFICFIVSDSNKNL